MLSLTRILIASDDSVFTRALSSAIESSAQLSITGIYSSGDGLTDTILHEQPDALLIDLMIPGINAFSLLKERTICRRNNVPPSSFSPPSPRRIR